MATGVNLRDLIEKSLPRDQALPLALFAERLFERLPADLADRLPPPERLSLARGAFEFFSTRTEPIQARVLTRALDGRPVTVIETLMPDRPFIVDSLREYLHELDLPLRLLLHPVFSLSRDAQGGLVSFERAAASETRESFIHAELDVGLAPEAAAQLAAELRRRLGEVLQATDDFGAMTSQALAICEELAPVRELVEVRDFLRWLVQGGFVFLGYRRYRIETEDGRRTLMVDPGSGLGILRAEERSRFFAPQPLDTLDAARLKLLFEGPVLIVGKTRAESHVHRRRAMDDVTIRRLDALGQTVAFDRFIGLFTSKAYAEEAEHIPVLRAKLRELLDAERALPGSHDYKEMVAAFNSFPKEELFRAPVSELRSQLGVILDVRSEENVRLSLHPDANRNSVIALVVMPREHFSAEVRMKIQNEIGRRLGGPLVYYYLALTEGYTARLHFCYRAAPPPPGLRTELEREIAKIARSWEDRLREHLAELKGAAKADALCERWRGAFSADYRASTDAARAAVDIERIEAMLAGGAATVECGPAPEADQSELRMYELGEPLVLSDLMPLLQNFDIRVLSEDAHEFRLELEAKTQRAFVQAFRVQGPGRQALTKLPGCALVAEALVAVRSGLAENDPLDSLTLSAALTWREVALVRAYLAAAWQMRLAPARPALRRVLLQHPQLARTLVDLFVARLDPEQGTPPERVQELRTAYLDRLAEVENIADDRVARCLLAMVEATVRTNYFRPIPSPDPYIALKFESAKIPDLPDTRPLYEIHVNSPRMEGCHLRHGKVARGGIRFSDRPDDYRTEILGLMKTQTVKNAIIVPVGAKGGFVVKGRAGVAASPEEVKQAYRTLIGAMLELTDNLVNGRIVRPERVKVLDSDGAYLVVAADKGTASFSDIANELAERRGFWLGDAFASGGRHGYDHKKLGITARGAWESVKRHLREIGRDVDRGAPVTMVGIGDMSGDVFGNGLLRSDNLKLVSAFDHRHIFIDPDPDPKKSFAERKRLFELPGSQWSDYDQSLLSRGGGVFRRGQKRIALSAEARATLGCEESELDGESLIRAVLRADVDLLYNGGIGTYVRASDETDAQVGDHANDGCRVTAAELRARVVVEGGNLGLTQKARVEYALKGGRINTDAIDNSAGVDMSDHEVNLKILLQPAVARGALGVGRRNYLLEQAAAEVAETVLADNYDQALMLSLEQIRSRTQVSSFRDLLTAIEQRGWLRREEEALPTREALRERKSRFPGLTRPELAVLTAYTKLDLSRRIEAASFIDDPWLVERFLRPYFPASITAEVADDVPRHSLRRELVGTAIVNEMVNLMGSAFAFSLARDYGVGVEDAVRAWLCAAGLLELRGRAERIKAAASAAELTVEAEMSALFALERAAVRASRWAIVTAPAAVSEVVGRFGPALGALAAEFESFLAAGERERFERVYRELRSAGHREEAAHELARLFFADHLLDVLALSFELGAEPRIAAQIYFRLAEPVDFALLEGALEAAGGEDRWERRAAQELDLELRATRIRLARSVMADLGAGRLDDALRRIRQARERQFDQAQHLLAELRTLPGVSLPALQVAVRALARLA